MSSPARAESTWSHDLPAGLVVFLVAVPLCLGIALASGAPLVSGLISGVVGGIVVALVGRAPLMVSGPAAGLAAIVLEAIHRLGSFEAFLAAVVVAGAFQIALALGRTGRFAKLVPSSVVTGMLAAIGVLLLVQQIPRMMGVTPPSAHGFGLFALPFLALPQAALAPTAAGLVALVLVSFWDKAPAPIKKLPGALVAVVVGTLVGEGLGVATALRVDLPDTSQGLGGLLIFPDFGALASAATWTVAVTLAIVASLESLLSLEATDRMDPLKRKSDADRELTAQGVGNVVSGLLGGLPLTGVIVRSAANVGAGARTWRSAVVHGALLAVAVFAVPAVLERIPLSVLAAILVHTGWKLAHPSRFVTSWKLGSSQFVPLTVTVLGVVGTELLTGVGLGIAASILITLYENARHGVLVTEHRASDGHRVSLELTESMSFVHKTKLNAVLDAVPSGAEVVVDGTRTRAFDHDVLELLHAWAETARERGIRYQLVAVPAR